MTALAMDVRELTVDEVDLITGGGVEAEGAGSIRKFMGCAGSLAGMGLSIIIGITGPAAMMLFAFSAAQAFNDCAPD